MRLIYICGVGRSGSTVIERVLSSSPAVFAVGEFHCLWRLPMQSLTCSCGKPMQGCNFWRAIITAADIDGAWLRRMKDLEYRVARHGLIARERFDLERLRRLPEVREFVERRMIVLTAVADASGADIVIDSSKAPPHAWLLAACADPLILHLQRDSRDWIASVRTPKFDQGLGEFQRKPGFLDAVGEWTKTSLSLGLLARQTPINDISYEHFADSPRLCLEQSVLGSTIKSALDTIAWTAPASVSPSPDYHSLMGNPDRYVRTEINIGRRSALANLSGVERAGSLVVGNLLNGLRRIF